MAVLGLAFVNGPTVLAHIGPVQVETTFDVEPKRLLHRPVSTVELDGRGRVTNRQRYMLTTPVARRQHGGGTAVRAGSQNRSDEEAETPHNVL